MPLPFFPPALRRICELTPFAATSNVPYRVYSGDIAGTNVAFAVGLQIFWLLVLVLGGHTLMKNGAEAGSDSGRINGTTSRSAARQIVRVLQYTKKGVIYETIL